MKLINFVYMLFRKLHDFFSEEDLEEIKVIAEINDSEETPGSNEDLEIIDPEQSLTDYQVISPQEYEFNEEEKLSVLRIYDYIHLPQLASEKFVREEG